MLSTYFSLTKPKMIRGNAIIAAAGFFFASQANFNGILFIAMLIGLALVIGAGCVINNVIDVGIDAKMNRTKNRALVKGEVSKKNALIYASILFVMGIAILQIFTNTITAAIAVFGAFAYVALYTPLKHTSHYAAVVGTLSGATPIAIGYTAVTQHIDGAALLLFIIMLIWQLPHFYAIAIYRFDEYKAANVPVLPITQGIECAKLHIVVYIPVFITAALSLTLLGYTGYIFAAVILVLGIVWFIFALRGFKVKENNLWSKMMYKYSLVVIMLFAVAISLESFF